MKMREMKVIDLIIGKQNLFSFFCFFQILLVITFVMSGNGLFLKISSLFLPFNILFLFLMKKIHYKETFLFLIFLFILLIFGILSPVSMSIWMPSLIIGINTFLIALIFNNNLAFRFIYFLLFFANCFVFFKWYQSGYLSWFGEELIPGRSRNIVSAYLIVFQIYYFVLCDINSKKINVFLSFFTFLNCILLFGRTGIVLGFMLFLFAVYKRYGKVFFIGLLTLGSMFLGVIYTYIFTQTNFERGLDSPRSALYRDYFMGINQYDLFFGRNISQCCSLIASYTGNPHNSFILGHSQFGIMHTITFTIIFVVVILSRKIELVFLLFILYFRYYFDTIGMFSVFDMPIFLIFIQAYKGLFLNQSTKRV